MANRSWSYVDRRCCAFNVRLITHHLSIATEGLQLTDQLNRAPFVGEGVNCALYDSLQLAQQIIKHGLDDLRRAVSEYEALMLPRGVDLVKRSMESGELLFAPDAPRSWLKAFAGIDSA